MKAFHKLLCHNTVVHYPCLNIPEIFIQLKVNQYQITEVSKLSLNKFKLEILLPFSLNNATTILENRNDQILQTLLEEGLYDLCFLIVR